MDVNRLGEALARPGMDPRVWACRAVVTKVVVDPEHGVLADILFLPSEIRETAEVAPMYAGAGFGFYLPLREGDTVLVIAPNGAPDDGLQVVARVWDGADPPPSEVGDNPEDPLLFVRSGRTLRIIVEGGGDAVIEVRDDGVVKLGTEDAAELSRAAREGDTITIAGSAPGGDLAALQTNLDARYTIGAGAPLTPVAGVINSGSDKVKEQ